MAENGSNRGTPSRVAGLLAMSKPNSASVVLCDLDGVVWLAHEPIDGAVDAVSRLRNAGSRVVFVTNNSFSTRAEQVAALGHIGIAAEGDVVTSAMSAASALQPGWRVLVCGGQGLIEEVDRAGANPVVAYQSRPITGQFDAVVVGFHREFDFQVLTDALSAVRHGAVLVGSNDDPTYPTPLGPIPGGGSILAAVEKATGVSAIVTGKPNEPMAQLVREMCPDTTANEMVMVGDRPDTDGAFAITMGCRYALVLSGVTTTDEGSGADIVAPSLSGVADILLG
jgi:4-nitrophenyl phosphatase